jgi:hypothetical protein
MSKAPITKSGFHDALTDCHEVHRLYTERPDLGLGLVGGCRIGAVEGRLFVLDLDIKPDPTVELDGVQAVQALAAAGMELHRTKVVQTWSGGWHVYMLENEPKPIGRRIRLRVPLDGREVRTGIDVCGAGGYWIAPPTVIEQGGKRGEYRTARDLPIAWAPRWLLDLAKPVPPPPVREPDPYTGQDRGAEALLTQACADISSAGKGERHLTVYRSAITAGRLVGAGRLLEATAREHLEQAARLVYGGRLDRRTRDQVARGIQRGKANPLQSRPR